VTQRAWPAEVLAVERPVCAVCLRAIKPDDVVSGPRNALMHQQCDDARARANLRSRPEAKLVLVVDDDDDHRTMYAMFLHSAGFRVIEAEDGTSAIGKARDMRPDVILLDVYMPGLNGWQACRWLKTNVETSRIPVVVFTGHAVESSRQEAMEAGCDRFITKGRDPQHVVQAIRDVLGVQE
jgi:two-component system cell cycle response regulator DivK